MTEREIQIVINITEYRNKIFSNISRDNETWLILLYAALHYVRMENVDKSSLTSRVSKSTATGYRKIDRLLNLGYLDVQVDKRDQRRSLVTPSDKARQKIDAFLSEVNLA